MSIVVSWNDHCLESKLRHYHGAKSFFADCSPRLTQHPSQMCTHRRRIGINRKILLRFKKRKKIVLEMLLYDEKEKRKAMQIVSELAGVNSISMDMKEKKMTVIGEVDPICMVRKLRKFRQTEIISVGPPKEEEKKKPPMEDILQILNYRNNYPFYCVEMPHEHPSGCVIL